MGWVGGVWGCRVGRVRWDGMVWGGVGWGGWGGLRIIQLLQCFKI